jgi:hypothetical protein
MSTEGEDKVEDKVQVGDAVEEIPNKLTPATEVAPIEPLEPSPEQRVKLQE